MTLPSTAPKLQARETQCNRSSGVDAAVATNHKTARAYIQDSCRKSFSNNALCAFPADRPA